ncbi:hypothetical protein X773_03245 [Mesorhizobium sp. LSJC285A00]|nr:hypothetical protein X773_03245 [Mesorhizobium sp. LSJC285A00]
MDSAEPPYHASGSAMIARSGLSGCAKKNQCHQSRKAGVAAFEGFQDRDAIHNDQMADR